MNNRDWTLLLLRGFGLYLLTLALDYIPRLVISIYMLFAMTEFNSGAAAELRSEYATRAMATAIHLLMYGSVGFLFVKGEPVLRWLRLQSTASDPPIHP